MFPNRMMRFRGPAIPRSLSGHKKKNAEKMQVAFSEIHAFLQMFCKISICRSADIAKFTHNPNPPVSLSLSPVRSKPSSLLLSCSEALRPQTRCPARLGSAAPATRPLQKDRRVPFLDLLANLNTTNKRESTVPPGTVGIVIIFRMARFQNQLPGRATAHAQCTNQHHGKGPASPFLRHAAGVTGCVSKADVLKEFKQIRTSRHFVISDMWTPGCLSKYSSRILLLRSLSIPFMMSL